MKVLRLELWDWRRWRGGPHVFEFHRQGTVITGPNESGKSTIFEGIRRALFDRNRTGGAWAARLVPYDSAGALPRAILEFEHGDRHLRIEKSFGARGETLLAEVGGGGVVPIARQEDACEELLRILEARPGSSRGGSRPEDWGAFQWLFMPQSAGERALPDARSDAVGRIGLGQAGVSRDYDLVLDAARREYERWLTPTGRERAGSELHAARTEIESLEERKAELARQIAALETRRREYDEVAARIPQRQEEYANASRTWEEVAEEAIDHSAAQGALDAAAERVRSARLTAEEGEQVTRERARRAREAAEAEAELRRQQAAGAEFRVALDTVNARWQAARDDAARRGRRDRDLRTALIAAQDLLSLREKSARLAELQARREQAEALDRELVAARGGRRGAVPDPLVVKRVRAMDAEMRAKRAALSQAQLRVRREGASPMEVRVDGRILEEAAGTAFEEVVIVVPGQEGRVLIEGHAREARALEAAATEVERELAILMEPFGAHSIDELEEACEKGIRTEEQIASMEKQRAAVDPAPTTEIQARIAELSGDIDGLKQRTLQGGDGEEARDAPSLKAEIASLDAELAENLRALEAAQAERQGLDDQYAQAHARNIEVRSDLEAAQELEGKARRELDLHRDQHGSTEACAAELERRRRDLEAAVAEETQLREGLTTLEKEVQSRRTTARLAWRRAQDALHRDENQMGLLAAELERESAQGTYSRLAEVERRLVAEGERVARLDLRARAAAHLRAGLDEVRSQVVERVVTPIREALDRHLAQVTLGRYTLASLDQNLIPERMSDGQGQGCEFADGSEGLRELVNTLIRLSVAIDLSRDGAQTLILDDPCVHVSRERTGRLVELLNRLVDEHPLQLIVLTHRSGEFGGLAGEVIDLGSGARHGARGDATASQSPSGD